MREQEAADVFALTIALYEAPDFVRWQAAAASLLVACLAGGDSTSLPLVEGMIRRTRQKWNSRRPFRESLAPSLN